MEDLLDTAAASLDAVAEEAERAVERIRAEARRGERARANAARISAQPPAILNERERLVGELTRTLADRAEALGREAKHLAGMLARARAALLDASHDTSEEPDQGPSPGALEEDGPGGESSSGRRAGPDRRPSEGMKLLVAQMAVAGSSRAEIEHRLRSEFDIGDAGVVVSEVLDDGGTSGGGEER